MGDPIWLASTEGRAGFSQLTGGVDVDVAVIGGGIAGITTALLCKEEGARVAVIERGTVAGGTTGSTTAKATALQQTKLAEIRRLHGDEATAAYASASLDALAWMERTVRERAIDCAWERLPDITYAADREQLPAIEATATAASVAGLALATTPATPLPFDVAGAVRLEGQAQFHPVRYVRALAEAIPGDGSHIFERTTVTAVREGSPCVVTAEGGATVTAETVAVCSNYPLLDRGLFFARMEAARSYLIAARVRSAGPAAMAISAGEPTRSVRSFADDDGRPWVLVGGEGHLTGSDAAEPARYEALERFARTHFDVIEIGYRWSAQDGMPLDRLPYAGLYTHRSRRLFVNAGHQKWGMTNATVGARLLADRIAGRDNRYGALLDPNRITVRAAPALARAQLHVGAHLLGDRLTPADRSTSEGIPPGEARTVRDGLGKVGVYRDDAGALHAVSLRCTHLGCLLHWNGAEQSWDCPCHGSRFDVDGGILAGPATTPLQRRDPPR